MLRWILSWMTFWMACGHSAEWPQWRGPGHDGRWNPPGVPADPAACEPQCRWTVEVGGGFGGVTVADGRVYLMERVTEPEERERLRCFSAEDGTQLWVKEWPVRYASLEYGNGPRSSVTLSEGAAFALGATGRVGCWDAATGVERWHRDVVEELGARQPKWGFAASPVREGENILLHVGAQPEGCVVALQAATGEEVWRGGDDAAGYCTPMVVTHGGRRQVIQWGPGRVMGLEAASGSTLWSYPYPIRYGVSIAQPLYLDGLLLVSSYWHGARALRLNAAGDAVELAWKDEEGLCGLMAAPLEKEGTVFFLDRHHGLQALDLATGKIHWRDENTLTPADRNPQMSLVWMDETRDLAALLNADGELVMARLTAEARTELGRWQVS
ncbi:MAG: PQQ-like beta-propeller repeat protein, partial [Verrucomicrobiales bacterium]|nr:PQQ-like beta-propeller repeat protein [Verrucomicrobiales bacterium]